MTDSNLAPYDLNKTYDVRLMRHFRIIGVDFYPLNDHEMTGAFLNMIVAQEGSDAIDTATVRN